MNRTTETLLLVREIARMLHDVRGSALKPNDGSKEWDTDLTAIETRASELMEMPDGGDD